MNKKDLHPTLQRTCVPIPERSGCFAVVPPLVPKHLDIPACHGLLASARSELQHLTEAIAQNIEHARILMHMLNRREAVDSSQIEGTQTGFDGLLLHELETGASVVESEGESGSETKIESEDEDARETYAYLKAFIAGSKAIDTDGKKSLTPTLLCAMHGILLADQPAKMPGKTREIQNFIGLRLETAAYVPPPAREVNRLLTDLAGLLQYEPEGVREISVLVRAAIAHAQFEAIHPFLDGNGRTGRVLLPLMFKAEGLPPIHLATFLKVRQREYYSALLAVQTRLEWAPWLRLFLECVIASCRHTKQLLAHLQRLQTQWREKLVHAKKRKHAAVWKVIDLLLGQPVINVNEIVRKTGVTFPAANQAVIDLMAMDILRPANTQRRHRVFLAHEVMNALYTGLDQVLEQAADMGRPL